MVYSTTQMRSLDILSDFGAKLEYILLPRFKYLKTNSLKITRMFTLFINKASNNSNYIHLLPSWKNTFLFSH